jgi:stage IV sporulation protein FB
MAAASFRIGSIPVRIHATFFITSVFLSGAVSTRNIALAEVVTWMSVVLVSVMVHELGHAMMGKAFGLAPEIDLHGMGGTTSWQSGRRLTTLQSIAVSVAGPGVGLVLGGALWLYSRGATLDQPHWIQLVVAQMIYVNVAWGIFNLLPMFPLDGGNALRSVLVGSFQLRGARATHVVSLVVAALLALGAWVVFHDWWVPLLCAMFAAQNWRALQALRAVQPPPPAAPYGV